MGNNPSRRRRYKSNQQRQRTPAVQTHWCEVEVAEGLEQIAQQELQRHVQTREIRRLSAHRGAIRFEYQGELAHLLDLKTVNSVYLLLYYDISRPRALLGHEHYHRLLNAISLARTLADDSVYQSMYVSAAGSDTSVMTRLKDNLASNTGLRVADDEGDLLLRIRRNKPGWDVLVRLSPRPLATRNWRVCNMAGALDAAVAHAMLLLNAPKPDEVFLNLTCGSGTLMIERLTIGTAQEVIGCDIATSALECARANIKVAGYDKDTCLCHADACCLPFKDGVADTICADLPFGQLVGTHEENLELYPQLLQEATRVARTGATFLVITHEVRLMAKLLAVSTTWHTEKALRITLGGLHPRIFVLRKI